MSTPLLCFGGQQCTHCTCNHNWRVHDMDGHCSIAECGCKKFEEKHSKRTVTKDAT